MITHDNGLNRKQINEAAKIALVQKAQREQVDNVNVKISQGLTDLSDINDNNLSELETLLNQSEAMLRNQGITPETVNYETIDTSTLDSVLALSEEELRLIKTYDFGNIDVISLNENTTWDEYLANIDSFAESHNIDLSVDPFKELMTKEDYAEIKKRIEEDYTLKKAQCDKYDYIIAASSGVICGLIDAFFVGMPGASKLGNWTDKTTDKMVEAFSTFVYKSDLKKGDILQKKAPEGIASCIGYLERRFKVNYDARYASDLGLSSSEISMAPINHHLKSLGHAPDIVGLFFSLLDQFTNTTSLISDGQIIRIENNNNNFRLQGGNFIAKLFCGFCNWIGHIMSDIAGSSGTRGHQNNARGSGVGLPFFEFFQLCDFGSFDISGEKKTLAELSTKVFQEGYDARHGAAMAIPVFLNEIIIRFSFTLKRKFYHKKSWKESLPFGNQPELRRMLVVGHGCLCLVDGIDAAIRSAKSGPAFVVDFALHLNIVAWSKFAMSGLREIWIICGKSTLDLEALHKDLDLEWRRLSSA